mmetsp:Transcript_44876/g.43458  ORF Transcript_44876/g.43458 Transcript_44876/m.43458 type:complete len:202 (+) Transcript_44876:352-957(+)|eukprot:CAMPEP_0170555214 /NCGR_PEP_ID=MMETSP0211-20121228/13109_1 /TAXON_ID=311385 /ORGANISM="Pseudokeronopsis sp., Strain OXSARD2" /LENGTH=201 /DNA_ID=CAMNT_0010864903 /DNA_START=324 /DNA_END=929 /DNA_ORIENTATION=+
MITTVLSVFQKQIYGRTKPYSLNQKLGIAMVLIHYIKRELETLFVHRFSTDTMPFSNVFLNSFHYWVIFGFINMYFFLHPDYTPPKWTSDNYLWISFACFLGFEFLNLMCHITMMNLRRPGTTERGIPRGWGFDTVSCANYLYETLCWILFAVQSNAVGAYIFLAISFFQMLDWALKKHKRYVEEFPNYPKNRKSMVPFII